jgi:hypothetical protein
MFSSQLGRMFPFRSRSGPDQHHAEVNDGGAYGDLVDTIDAIIRDLSSGDPAPIAAEQRRRRGATRGRSPA